MASKPTIFWIQPTTMVGLWLCGFAFAIGHHSYYLSLDGELAENQEMVIRYGTACAFFTKASVAASAGIAIRQFVWSLVRSRQISVAGLDACFSLTSDPTAIVTLELWRKTPTLVIFGALFFLMPLAAIVTPSAISVVTVETALHEECRVPSLDFGQSFDWSYKTPQLTLATYHGQGWTETLPKSRSQTSSLSSPPSLPSPETSVKNSTRSKRQEDHVRRGSYAGPSPYAHQLIRRVFVGGNTLEFPSPCGSNCTYSVNIPGIGYQCKQIDGRSPAGRIANLAVVDPSEIQLRCFVGVFFSNRSLTSWVSQQELRKNATGQYSYVNAPEFFSCAPWHVNYEVQFMYVNNIFNYRVLGEEFLSAIEFTTFRRNSSLSMSYAPTNYWAYQSLADVLAQHINGSMFSKRSNGQSSTTLLSATTLVGYLGVPGNPNQLSQDLEWPRLGFRDRLVALVRNVSLSLLESPYLYIRTTQETTCTKLTNESRFMYDQRPLWIAYSALGAYGALMIWLGAAAIWTNGYTSGVSFSRFLCTTRNTALDAAVVGERFGAQPLGEKVKRLVLQFGKLKENDHVAFGTPEHIVPLGKGEYNRGLA